MSYSSLKKKLQPAKKALKSLTKSLESKLHSFSFSESLNAIKTTSHRLLSYCSRSLHRRRRRRFNSHLYQSYYSSNRNNKNRCYKSIDFSPIHVEHFYSTRSPASVPAKSLHPRLELSRRSELSKRKIVTDKIATEIAMENGRKGKEKILYSIEDAWREVVAKSPQLRPIDDRKEEFIVLSKGKFVTDKIATENGRKGKEKILYSIEDAWREVVAKSPQLRPIDDRAEEFISNFRREMRLQKDKSIGDY